MKLIPGTEIERVSPGSQEAYGNITIERESLQSLKRKDNLYD
jgi:hypothetical protein